MNRTSFYISTICDVVPGRDPGTLAYVPVAAPAAVRYGLGLELAEYCISDNMDDDSGVRAHFRANCAAVSRRVMHAPYNELCPHAVDRRVAAVARERLDAAYAVCEAAGCAKLVVHANYMEALYHPDWFVDRQVEFWSAFLQDHPGEICLCLENVMEQSPEVLLRAVRGVNNPRFALCLDVGHANLTRLSPMEWLEACAPFVSHMHIHNNEGPVLPFAGRGDTHSALGRGSIPMERLLRRAQQLVPEVTLALETQQPQESIDWLEERGFLRP